MMIGDKFLIDTRAVKKTVESIERKTTEYENDVKKLYTAINQVRNHWKGKETDMFTTQIEGFRDDFTELINTLKNYTDSIQSTIQKCDQAEDRLIQAANRLNI